MKLGATFAICWLVTSPTVASASQAPAVVARWSFGTEETSKLIAHGGVHRDQPGPRPPEFPDFELYNTAVRFDGSGAHYSLADPGPASPFDFTTGDAITLEAWVHMAEVQSGENLYIIGKGRTGDPAFARDNQNWALRVRELGGQARISFLFATTPKPAADKDAHWHRWTSKAGFAPGSGWHHVAVSYRFGEPASIRGWLDGAASDGAWDMGGATREPPVVDDDELWIGSSQGGNAGNSFRGMLDEIAVHRGGIADDVMRRRFRREGPPRPSASDREVSPVVADLPAGRVLVTFHEGLAAHDRWPNADELPTETTRWLAETFIFPRLPMRYDDWGIRQGWKSPVLVRAAADVQLPPGKHRFLVRARGLSRLWINGAVAVRTKPHGGSSDGHEPVPPLSEPPAPGMRPVGYGDREVVGEVELPADGQCRVIFEAIAGGKKLRPEPGEMCVAVQSLVADGARGEAPEPFVLLDVAESGDLQLLTDAVWDVAAARAEGSLAKLDERNRRSAAASQDAFWANRHKLARDWVAQHPAPDVPKTAAAAHPIDAFITAKIDRALAAAATANPDEAKHFHGKVLPILRDNCFRCHGDKKKGGLRLNSRQAALDGGDSGEPAIEPGDPAASPLIDRVRSPDADMRMPPTGEPLAADEIAVLDAWIKAGASWPAPPVDAEQVARPPIVGDAAFLRRAYLDTLGVPPTETEARAFLTDTAADKRARLIDQLLADPRGADHWVSYWQDVLAENPSILKPSLNNSGPFRWFLHDAIRDGKPLDRMVTELVLMRGSPYEGGSAGFGMAADNDAPLAAKAQILGSAFLGVELQCARCHDSPYHSTTQRDLYALSALLDRKPLTVPKTSTVPAAFFDKKERESLIRVTLKPGEPVAPSWPFEKLCGSGDSAELDALLQDPRDPRERFAALITAPQNGRFARVVANRVWKRLIGAGLVEPVHDWEGRAASHPELLDWLACELVAHDYDLGHVVRVVMTSAVYQREATGQNLSAAAQDRYFAAPERRRLSAEQVVDSLFAAAGKSMQVEELSFDPDARRPAETFISLGRPTRAWMFGSLSNERDRPSLSLPRAQAVTDVLEAFGWTGSRQNPRSDRPTDPNVLQPGVLANSVVSSWVTRVSADSGLAQLAISAESPESLVDSVFLRFLARLPTADERARFERPLEPGFAERQLSQSLVKPPAPWPRLSKVSWSNHLVSEANQIQLEMERRARAGDPPDPRIEPAWRETFEDFVWSIINSPEFVWVP
jgi:hypothetical protein